MKILTKLKEYFDFNLRLVEDQEVIYLEYQYDHGEWNRSHRSWPNTYLGYLEALAHFSEMIRSSQKEKEQIIPYLTDVLPVLKTGDSKEMRFTSEPPQNEGSMVTKHLDSDLLSAELPNGIYSQLDGSSLSKNSYTALGAESKALYPRPKGQGFTVKNDKSLKKVN